MSKLKQGSIDFDFDSILVMYKKYDNKYNRSFTIYANTADGHWFKEHFPSIPVKISKLIPKGSSFLMDSETLKLKFLMPPSMLEGE